MTPLPPGALEHLLKNLPPEQEDPSPHLADLSADQLLERRVEISEQLKTLEQERQAIDLELLSTFSEPELRIGVRAPGGWVLRQRSRTSWAYPPEVREAIKTLQQQAQRDGRAQPLPSTYLVALQATRNYKDLHRRRNGLSQSAEDGIRQDQRQAGTRKNSDTRNYDPKIHRRDTMEINKVPKP
jgi:hypothetical protein